MSRIYCVTFKDSDGPARLVRARTRAQAIAYVARNAMSAELATFADGVEAGRMGIETEDATAEPEAALDEPTDEPTE